MKTHKRKDYKIIGWIWEYTQESVNWMIKCLNDGPVIPTDFFYQILTSILLYRRLHSYLFTHLYRIKKSAYPS